MATAPQKDSGPAQKGVKFTGRSASARRAGSPQPRAIGAWRRELRKGIVWDRKSVTFFAAGSACLLLIAGVLSVSFARSAGRDTVVRPKPIADGLRVAARTGPDPNIPVGMSREERVEADVEKWTEVVETSKSPEEVAHGWCTLANIHQQQFGDFDEAMRCYMTVIDNYPDTPALMSAVSGAVFCAEEAGDDDEIVGIYNRALRRVGPGSPNASKVCYAAIARCGEASPTGKAAQALLDKVQASMSG